LPGLSGPDRASDRHAARPDAAGSADAADADGGIASPRLLRSRATTLVETVTEPTPTVPTTTDTDTGPIDTAAAPPPNDNGFLGWFALVLAALRGETTTGETPTTTTVDTVPAETIAPEPESAPSESETPVGMDPACLSPRGRRSGRGDRNLETASERLVKSL
jgi:hypothetical protein